MRLAHVALVAGALARRGPRWSDGCFLLCDAWAASVLPTSYARFPRMYGVVVDALRYERRLQMVPLVAVLLLAGGMLGLLRPSRDWVRLGGAMRALGLGATGMLWVGIGGGFLMVAPMTLSAVPFLVIGSVAWGIVLAGPDARDGLG